MSNLHLASQSYQSTFADRRLCVDYLCFISTDTRGGIIFRRGAHGGNKRKVGRFAQYILNSYLTEE